MGDFLQAKGYETVSVYRNGGAAKLELSRPDRMNALNGQMRTDLLAAVEEVGGDDGIRAVLLTGAGRAFSSGAGLREDRDPGPAGHPGGDCVPTGPCHPIIPGTTPMPKP